MGDLLVIVVLALFALFIGVSLVIAYFVQDLKKYMHEMKGGMK